MSGYLFAVVSAIGYSPHFIFYRNRNREKILNSDVYFFGKGVGDLNIKCQCRSVIETYDIEDCSGFNTMTSSNDMSLLNIPNGVPIQYSNDGANLNYTKSNTGYTFNLKAPYTEPVSIEFELINNGTDDMGLDYVPIMNFRNSHSDNSALAIQGISPKTKLRLSGSDSVYTDKTVSSVIGVYKILLTSDTEYSIYLNDVFVHTITNASISTKGMSIFIGRLRSATIRNLKIKPL